MSARSLPDVATGRSQRRESVLAAELLRRWRLGQPPSVEGFVDEWEVHVPQELAAIVRVDLRERWRRGERPEAAEYFARFQQLCGDAELVVDVIYAEFLARDELGDVPDLADFESRFPLHAEALRVQIEFYRAFSPHAEWATETRCADSDPAATRSSIAGYVSRLPNLGPDYEILAEIGRGGMGIVYRANQVSLNRLVALKMVRAADHGSSELLTRFRAEAAAVARLHHPNIVQIYDYGEHDGAPYLALELVEGSTLAAAAGGRPWPARPAAKLLATLARAVHFAHQQGVVHRDLKPANILLSSRFQVPGSKLDSEHTNLEHGTWNLELDPKIADFGLAKVFTEQTQQTQTGAILGTPSYMAPELAFGRSQQVVPATDVYALGAILYELLSGRPPFQANSALETLQQVLVQEPVSLWRWQPQLSRDLATICTKCLSKEPRQRYASAEQLAEDLERFLNDRPILARPASHLERSWRWCRRNPAVALLTGSVAALLLVVATVSSILSLRLNAQLQRTGRAESAERSAKQAAQLRLYEAYLAEATAKYTSRRIGQRFGTLETVDKANAVLDEVGRTPDRILPLRNALIAALALPDLRRLRKIGGWPSDGSHLDFSAAADRYVVATATGELFVYRLSDGRELMRLAHRQSAGPAITRDGKYVAANDNRGAKIWRIDPEPPAVAWEELGAAYVTLAPDSRHAAVSGADGRMHLLELATGHKIRQLGRGAARFSFAFHSPSQRVAVCGADSIQVISVETGAVLTELPPPQPGTPYPSIAWHPSGEFIAASGYADGIALWHVASQRRARTYPHVSGTVLCHFVAGGEQLLTIDSWGKRLHLWHTATQRELLSDPAFHSFASDVTTAGQQLLLALEDSGAGLWEVQPGAECVALPHGLERSLAFATSTDISPDGGLLAVGRVDGLELWDLATRRRLASLEMSRNCFSRFVADGSLITHCESGIYRWPRQESTSHQSAGPVSELAVRFGPPARLHGPTHDHKFALTAVADRLVIQDERGWLIARPDQPGRIVRIGPQSDPRTVSLTADGRWVALGSWNSRGASIYDSRSGARLADLPVSYHADVLFSPDGQWLATSPEGVELWRTSDWRAGPKLRARGSTPGGLGIAFSPDSRVLAVGQPMGETRLVDPATGQDWATLVHPDGTSGQLIAFSPNQTQVVIQAGGPESAPHVWDLAAIRRELARRRLDWPADVLQPRPAAAADAVQARLTITLDAGNLLRVQQARDLIRQAGAAQTAAACGMLRQALEIDPDHVLAHNHLAWLLAAGPEELRDPAAAVRHARRAVELGGAQHTTLNTLGVALYRDEQYAEALQILQRSLALSPPAESPYDLIFLALCHAQQDEWPAAKDSLTRAETAIQAHRASLTASTLAELARFIDEARAAGLPSN